MIIIKRRLTQQLHMNKSIDLIVCFLIPHNIDILEDVYYIIYIHPVLISKFSEVCTIFDEVMIS